jgi:hypothetical protein
MALDANPIQALKEFDRAESQICEIPIMEFQAG